MSQIDEVVINPKPSSEAFKDRFMAKICTLKKGISKTDAMDAYYDFMAFVGNTTDGSPEDEAMIFVREGGL